MDRNKKSLIDPRVGKNGNLSIKKGKCMVRYGKLVKTMRPESRYIQTKVAMI